MSDLIELSYNCSTLEDFMEKLKCKLITIILKSGGECGTQNCCCFQNGYVCKVENGVVLLVSENKSRKTYIVVDAIAAVIIRDKCSDEENCLEQNKPKKNKQLKEKNPILKEDGCRIYGYGRKINIDFLKEKNNFAVTEINITELSVSLNTQNEEANNLIYYFHKDGINDRAIELLLSPTGAGKIDLITTNKLKTKAIIKGTALVYLDTKKQEEYEFKLLLTEDRILMKIISGDEIIEEHNKILVGICDQEEQPFMIN
ncbi:MAG: hypothetical protein ACQERJ_04005 [Bacillota bacterium]